MSDNSSQADISNLTNWNGPFDLPQFEALKEADFRTAFDITLERDKAQTLEIANNPDEPTFENTIVAFEVMDAGLGKVASLFYSRAGNDTDDRIKEIEREIAPKLAAHHSEMSMNPEAFARIDALYQKRDELNLSTEELEVLEKYWRGYVKNGAKLNDDDKKRLAEITSELAVLYTNFGQNVLSDSNDWTLHLTKDEEIAGLPDFLLDTLKAQAKERGFDDGYLLTLSRPVLAPFMQFSTRRDLREKAYKAGVSRGVRGGDTDNVDNIKNILKLRKEKATLLGYSDFAEVRLENTMAKSAENVNQLLHDVWPRALERAKQEEAELLSMAQEMGHNDVIEPWDWRFYSEKLREKKFDFSEAELKPYFQLDQMIDASFDVANRLFGLTFKQRDDITPHHTDAKVFEVFDPNGKTKAIFIADYFARPSKRSGAWMSAYQSQHKLKTIDGKDGKMPFIYNIMNFAKPADGEPALLSADDARTLFHEFGHALHGILSDVVYPSVSGTSVSRDFVELPSQLYEHWLTVPEILQKHATHYKTGNSIPAELVDKLIKSQTFNNGYETLGYCASSLVDIAFHTADEVEDPLKFQEELLEKLEMPHAVSMYHRAPHFLHVFSSEGYAAGYYSYMWSEVLDSDAFAAFEETDNPFNPDLAKLLHDHIYSKGGSEKPEVLYKKFRGRMPSPEAMIKKRGLETA